MAINWGLIGEPVDIGAKFREGWDRVKVQQREAQLQGALKAYAADPMNPQAQGALAALSPQFAVQFGQQKMAQAERQRVGSYFANPDRKAAMQSAYEAGDVDVAKQIAEMDAESQKRLSAMYKAMGQIAMGAKGLPYEQRRAYIMENAGLLLANGVTDELIANFDPSDARLDGVIRDGLTVEQQMPKSVTTPPGGGVYRMDPLSGGVTTAIAPNPGGFAAGSPVDGAPPVLTDEDIMRMENGGPTPTASGDFR